MASLEKPIFVSRAGLSYSNARGCHAAASGHTRPQGGSAGGLGADLLKDVACNPTAPAIAAAKACTESWTNNSTSPDGTQGPQGGRQCPGFAGCPDNACDIHYVCGLPPAVGRRASASPEASPGAGLVVVQPCAWSGSVHAEILRPNVNHQGKEMAKQRTSVLNTISATPGNEGMQAFTPMALLQLAAMRRSSL